MPIGHAAESGATLVFLGASMPRSTTSQVTSSAVAPVQATAPSRPPAGSSANRGQAQHALDLWVDLLSDLVVAEVCRERQATADAADGSDGTTDIGGAA
jgi:hypothetical protein